MGRLPFKKAQKILKHFVGAAIGKPARFGAKCFLFRGATLVARAPTGAGSRRESYPKI